MRWPPCRLSGHRLVFWQRPQGLARATWLLQTSSCLSQPPVGGVLVTGSWCWGIFIRETALLGCGITKSAQVQPSSWVTGSTGNTRDLAKATGLAASTRPSSPGGPAHGPRAEAVPQPLSAVGGGDAPAPSASPRASSSGRRCQGPALLPQGHFLPSPGGARRAWPSWHRAALERPLGPPALVRWLCSVRGALSRDPCGAPLGTRARLAPNASLVQELNEQRASGPGHPQRTAER